MEIAPTPRIDPPAPAEEDSPMPSSHPHRLARCALSLALLVAGTGWAAPAPAGAEELGTVHFPNSGAPEAQEPFQRGVAALHSFFYEEAERAFRRAQEADGDFAMAYWGEAMTYNHPLWRQQDREAARAALERLAPRRGERLAAAPTERERSWLEAVEILYGDGPKQQRDLAYLEAMEGIAERWPDDPEAQAFYALALQGAHPSGEEMMRHRIRSAAVLEALFDHHPEHPGVLHYLIHAYDDPLHAPLGLRPARRYARVAPDAPHALHMPSHIFVQRGLWHEVAASNRDAFAASTAWVEAHDLPPSKLDFHSYSWLHYSLIQLGRFREAEEIVEHTRSLLEEGGSIRIERSLAFMEARQVVGGLAYGGAGFEVSSVPPAARGAPAVAKLSAVGFAAVEAGELDHAGHLVGRLANLAHEEGADEDAWKIAHRQVEGLARLRGGERDRGLELLEEAVELESGLGPPSGPAWPLKPSHELLGEVLLELGRPAEARERFESALERMPNRAPSLLGAARAARALGEEEAAHERYATLADIWDGADPDVVPLDEVRSRGQVAP